MHGVWEVCISASHTQNEIVGDESKSTGESCKEHSKKDSTLLESPRDCDGAAANHGVPSVENDHHWVHFVIRIGLHFFGRWVGWLVLQLLWTRKFLFMLHEHVIGIVTRISAAELWAHKGLGVSGGSSTSDLSARYLHFTLAVYWYRLERFGCTI